MIRFLKRYKWIVILGLLLLVAGLSAIYFYAANKSQYEAFQVERGKILEAVYGIGTVYAWETFDLKVGVASVIRSIFVKEGDFVKKGDNLVSLDGPRLFKAPFDGTITSLSYKEGENVFPQLPILTITDFSDRYLIVSLEQQAAIRVKPNQEARLSFESMRNQYFKGIVETVYSKEDRFLVRISVDDLPKSVLPGMTADVSISIQEHDNALLIPIEALENGQVLVRRESGDEEWTTIETGVIDATKAQVVSGNISESDTILVKR